LVSKWSSVCLGILLGDGNSLAYFVSGVGVVSVMVGAEENELLEVSTVRPSFRSFFFSSALLLSGKMTSLSKGIFSVLFEFSMVEREREKEERAEGKGN
jgi:hypothetical protein